MNPNFDREEEKVGISMLESQFGQKHPNDFSACRRLAYREGLVFNVGIQDSGEYFDNNLKKAN